MNVQVSRSVNTILRISKNNKNKFTIKNEDIYYFQKHKKIFINFDDKSIPININAITLNDKSVFEAEFTNRVTGIIPGSVLRVNISFGTKPL